MKQFVLVLTLLVSMSVVALADDFSSLWKHVEQAREKDLPQTEMRLLEEIARKADANGAYGQLLKAEFLYAARQTDICPDSLPSLLKRLEQRMEMASKKDRALEAVYGSLLAKVFANNESVDDSYAARSEQLKRIAMSDPELLATTQANSYEPTVMKGIDSRYFNHDLLHIIAFEWGEYEWAYDYYKKVGNREAACLTAALSLRNSGKLPHFATSTLDEYIREYGDLAVAGELAIEKYNMIAGSDKYSALEKMKWIEESLERWAEYDRIQQLENRRKELILPRFSLTLDNEQQLTGLPFMVHFKKVCHLGTLQLNVYSTTLKGDYNEDESTPGKNFQHGPLVASYSKDFSRFEPYEAIDDSIRVAGLPAGVYLLEVVSDNKKVEVQYRLFCVSALTLISQQQANKQIQLITVNAISGKAMPGVTVEIKKKGNDKQTDTYRTDEKGELVLDAKTFNWRDVYIHTPNDTGCRKMRLSTNYWEEQPRANDYNIKLYTDRKIYRPGQTVNVAAIIYADYADHTSAPKADESIVLTLRDANYQEVGRKEIVSDSFGKAAAVFTLPASGLTGRYSIETNNASVSFMVEQYKRPTFEVKFNPITQNYAPGDTITLEGEALSYAGVPVQNSKVSINVVRTIGWWWWNAAPETTILEQTLTTNDNGRFSFRLPLTLDEESNYNQIARFRVEAVVTNQAGESQQAEEIIPIGKRKAYLSCSLPKQVLNTDLPELKFNYINAKGQEVPAQVHYTIDGKPFVAPTNVAQRFPLAQLRSGEHQLEAVCEGDTVKQAFIVFSLNDKRPPVTTRDWFYVSTDTFPNDGSPAVIQIGSSEQDQWVFYTLMTNGKTIEQGRFHLNNSNHYFRLPYHKDYGDLLYATFAWVKEGKFYLHQASISRPLPSPLLKMKWSTFRDLLIPGQQETWTLQITTQDGKPAEAQLMAVLFDKSLDRLMPHSWNLTTGIDLADIYAPMGGATQEGFSLYASEPLRYKNVRRLQLRGFDESLLYIYGSRPYRYNRRRLYKANTDIMLASANSMVETEVMASDAAPNGAVLKYETMDSNPSTLTSPATSSNQLRENLQETAFFYPALLTDVQGNVSIQFTLPESVTTWRFMGLAHDRQMRHTILEAEAVAQKQLMVQPNMPRFLRQGDKSIIAAQISNTTEQQQEGTAIMELIDPETLQVVYRDKKSFTVGEYQTTKVLFNYDATTDATLLICRISANGTETSDGEQHYLPILSRKEFITNTLTFTQQQEGIQQLDLRKLSDVPCKLTVEYTDNPAWLMIQALPTLATTTAENALSQAASIYSNRLAQYLSSLSPYIKTVCQTWQQKLQHQKSPLQESKELKQIVLNETPWVMNALHEDEQKAQLINLFNENLMQQRLATAKDKLHALQLNDGSWSWWKGMEGSYYMTTAVSELLARLLLFTGADEELDAMLDQATVFMEKKMIEEMNEMKKQELKLKNRLTPSETTLRFLYIDAISNSRLSAEGVKARTFMINRLAKIPHKYTIYGKAVTAVILAKNQQNAKAAEYLKSIDEYLVGNTEMGRYFDTRKAFYSWFDYRIPTQVAAIEAFQLLAKSGEYNTLVTDMQRWLLQCKRTQQWENPMNAVDAISAFLRNQEQLLTPSDNRSTVLKLNGNIITTDPTTALGYTKNTISEVEPQTLTVEKSTKSVSWGSVYAQYMTDVSNISASNTGLSIKRQVVGNDTFHVGDKVKVRIIIDADRDFDFVQVEDKRAACLEPVEQTSGYRGGYYITPLDTSTRYYFNCLTKGRHIIETEYFVDRAGLFTSGTCTVQCAYSAEFAGRGDVYSINIEQ